MSAGHSLWSSLRCGSSHVCQGFEERPPYVWEDGSPNGKVKTVGEALRVLTLILQQDRLGDGQRVDLGYVREVLCSLQDAQRPDRESQDITAILDNDDLDNDTQAWLLAFSNKVDKKHKLKDVANAVRMGIRMKHKLQGTVDNNERVTAAPVTASVALQGLESWNDFDVFKLNASSGGKPLQLITLAVMERRNIPRNFCLSKKLLNNFLKELESSYINNAYHNNIHAADVTQSVHCLLDKGMDEGLSDLEIFAVILAAACHDAGHMGVTNEFLVKNTDPVAITYNDRSVNENMHLAISYRILKKADCDFLKNPLTPKQRDSLRKMVVESVLGTDMAHHFINMNALKSTIEEKGSNPSHWDSTMPLLEACLHGADLSNTAKPKAIAFQWTDRVLEEFFLQGDQERRLGREPSPMCDRYSVCKPGSQTGFINFIVRPLFNALTPLCNTEQMLENLTKYHEYWSMELLNEKRKKQRSDKGAKGSLRLRKTVTGTG